MNVRKTKIVIAVTLIVGAVVLLMVTSTTKSGYTTDYYHSVSEFAGRADTYIDQTVRINGKVVAGSIRRTPPTATSTLPQLDFLLGDSLRTIPVHYEGTSVPDAFREASDVVVEGIYRKSGTLEARQLLVKCPSKYEAADPSGTKPATGEGY
jgi:cytochrome c-type biogenesis protein CcmE